MVAALILASVASGLIATAVMIVFLYLPLLWGGIYYDTLGALGAVFMRRVDERSRLLGAVVLFLGGIFFALFYGAFVLMFLTGPFPAPDYTIFRGLPVEINLFFPLLGLVGGLAQGVFMAMMTTFIVTDFHPLPEYRQPFNLILSYLVGHAIYGVVVTFFAHQFLQLLL